MTEQEMIKVLVPCLRKIGEFSSPDLVLDQARDLVRNPTDPKNRKLRVTLSIMSHGNSECGEELSNVLSHLTEKK